MKLEISSKAEKQLRKLSKLDQIVFGKKIRQVKDSLITKESYLKGFKNTYRIRIGDYRVVYIRKPNKIYIVLIGHRKEIYLLTKRLLG